MEQEYIEESDDDMTHEEWEEYMRYIFDMIKDGEYNV